MKRTIVLAVVAACAVFAAVASPPRRSRGRSRPRGSGPARLDLKFKVDPKGTRIKGLVAHVLETCDGSSTSSDDHGRPRSQVDGQARAGSTTPRRPQRARRFYGELLGWEGEDQVPPDWPGQYFMCRLRGHDVAAMDSEQDFRRPPMWKTYVTVESADDAAAAAIRSVGGTVLGEPLDVFAAGRIAVATEPRARPSASGRPRACPLVNEPDALCWTELTTLDPEGRRPSTAAPSAGGRRRWRPTIVIIVVRVLPCGRAYDR